MKLSISNIAWSNENDNEMYEYISNNGFCGLEIAPTRIFANNPYDQLETAKEFAKKIKEEYNLEVSSMQSIWYGKQEKIFNSKEEREELIEYTKKAIDFANNINCHNLVFGCPKNRNTQNEEDYEIAIQFFRIIGEYAKNKNTVFAIEPNPTIYNTNFINTTKDAFNIVDKIDCEAIKVNVDLGTIIENNENIDIIEENIDLINHIHISEPNLEVIQKRKMHNKLQNILHKTNYNKYISIEMKNQNNIEQVKNIIDYVREVFI